MGGLMKWSGSKEYVADTIIELFPTDIDVYYEPFVGGGSVLLALKPCRAVASDIDEHLIASWKGLKRNGIDFINKYAMHWRLLSKSDSHYYEARQIFNDTRAPSIFYFLLRTCYSGLVRYNADGEFNSPLQVGRSGMHPEKVFDLFYRHYNTLMHTKFIHGDYRSILGDVKQKDFIFFDPPYAGIKGNTMYTKKFDHDEFFIVLSNLNNRGIRWAVTYGQEKFPTRLHMKKFILEETTSSYRRKHDNYDKIQEVLYLNYTPPHKCTIDDFM